MIFWGLQRKCFRFRACDAKTFHKFLQKNVLRSLSLVISSTNTQRKQESKDWV